MNTFKIVNTAAVTNAVIKSCTCTPGTIYDARITDSQVKNSLIRKLGRDPLDNFQIDEAGKAWFGVKWGFVSDQSKTIPKTPDRYYIVNTAHSNKSPGYHWTALYISKSGKAYIYDSFARNVKALMPC